MNATSWPENSEGAEGDVLCDTRVPLAMRLTYHNVIAPSYVLPPETFRTPGGDLDTGLPSCRVSSVQFCVAFRHAMGHRTRKNRTKGPWHAFKLARDLPHPRKGNSLDGGSPLDPESYKDYCHVWAGGTLNPNPKPQTL